MRNPYDKPPTWEDFLRKFPGARRQSAKGQADWSELLRRINASYGVEGTPPEQRYRLSLSKEYQDLYNEASPDRRSLASFIGEYAGDEFASIVGRLKDIDLGNASAADIGVLIQYFSYRNKTLEEMTDGMKWERV